MHDFQEIRYEIAELASRAARHQTRVLRRFAEGCGEKVPGPTDADLVELREARQAENVARQKLLRRLEMLSDVATSRRICREAGDLRCDLAARRKPA